MGASKSRRVYTVNAAEVHAADQILEAGLGSKAIEFGVDVQEIEGNGALGVCLFKPGQGLILVAQPGIDRGKSVFRHHTALRSIQQFVQYAACLCFPAGCRVCVCQFCRWYAVRIPDNPDGILERLNSLREAALLLIGLAQENISGPGVWIDINTFLEFRHCLIVPAEKYRNQPESEMISGDKGSNCSALRICASSFQSFRPTVIRYQA